MVPPQLNPAVMMRLREAAANGVPGAAEQLQQLQSGGGGGMPPMQGAAPAGAIPPAPGMAGSNQLSPQGGGPAPSQAQAAMKAQMLIKLLQNQAAGGPVNLGR